MVQRQAQAQKVIVNIGEKKTKRKKRVARRKKKAALPPAQPVILGLQKIPPIVYEFNTPAPPPQLTKPPVDAPKQIQVPKTPKTPLKVGETELLKSTKQKLEKLRSTRRQRDALRLGAELKTPVPQNLFPELPSAEIPTPQRAASEPPAVRGRGRRPKYASPEERAAAQREQGKQSYQRRKAERETGIPFASATPVAFQAEALGGGFRN